MAETETGTKENVQQQQQRKAPKENKDHTKTGKQYRMSTIEAGTKETVQQEQRKASEKT